jgi:hypothetical protein
MRRKFNLTLHNRDDVRSSRSGCCTAEAGGVSQPFILSSYQCGIFEYQPCICGADTFLIHLSYVLYKSCTGHPIHFASRSDSTSPSAPMGLKRGACISEIADENVLFLHGVVESVEAGDGADSEDMM